MPTIIYPPSIPWNWMFQRPQQLLRQFANMGYTVLYEEPGLFPQPGAQKLSERFILCRGLSALKIPHPRPRILWLTVPSHIELIDKFAPDLTVYDAVDEPEEEFAGWKPYYPSVLRRAQLIFASSRSIFAKLSSQHPHVHLVPNGVDYSHFSARLPRPAELPPNRPLIGYSGAVAPWLDWDLLQLSVRSNPSLQFVFVGALFDLARFPLKGANVRYLGLKDYTRLPAYVQHFKIGLIPFKLNDMTKGCNPIKLYEYYAAGPPVLATPLPELLAIPKIQLEADSRRFSARLAHLAGQEEPEPGRAERQAFAQGNDWSVRAGQIQGIIDEIMRL
ncbi:putative teichuronic acid biosynthesis glycosyltransferase TuaH [Peptococcaceae bacterium CEB3]|nr:putative teichuronic acid biosynthesis glycosyltransferase TuaH [Peptococcaceae bacterium CEB3]